MSALDWPVLLRAAAARGLYPPQFWQLSLTEWRALSGEQGSPATGRSALDALRRQFPDRR